MSKVVSFAKLTEGLAAPDLVEVQKRSYWDFLQLDVQLQKRQNVGLQAAFLKPFRSRALTRPTGSTTCTTRWAGRNTPSTSACATACPTPRR